MRPFRKTNRAAFSNFLRAKYEMYTGAVVVNSLPYYLTLDASDRCQLRCTACPTGVENEERRRHPGAGPIYRSQRTFLSAELFDAVLDELGEYLFLLMFYNWGEPLLNRRLPEFIAKAHARDIFTDIHTNLSLPLSDRQIEELLLSGLDELNVSIDGFSQETYEKYRVGGNLALVNSNLERIVAARARFGLDTEIWYNFLVFSYNEHEVEAARSYCAHLGIEFKARDAFIHRPDWLPSHRKNELPVVLSEEHALPEAYQTRRGNEIMSWPPNHGILATRGPAAACGWHHGYPVVTPGGPVSPCAFITKDEHNFGTVIPGRVRFADVWNNDRYRAARAGFAGKNVQDGGGIETVCTHCSFPNWMRHVLSIYDVRVITQFLQAHGHSDPVLEEAFHQLVAGRWGPKAPALFAQKFPAMPVIELGGAGDETQMAPFTELFERKLLQGAELPAQVVD